ncbi:MAG: adenylate/guanylate cyclase domain-containing protein [bacterium]
MASSDLQRKLTAVLAADVVGYSRLMGEDPEATVAALTDRREVFFRYTEEFHGRIVNAPGDSILAEFASVLDAVSCAAEVQRELAEGNAELPEARRMEFRIGINLGDVLVKDGDLYGDGVNVAARLESIAEPGGICISGKAYEEVKARLPLHFEYIGKKSVKNIAEPVPAYRVRSQPGAAAHRVTAARRAAGAKWRKAVVAVVALLVAAGLGYGGWTFFQGRSESRALALFEKGAAFPLPDKPSIAVLAFDNLSGDPEQEYFSDGLSENIITRLARLTEMFVIARNSSFKYKGKQVDVRQVGRELGVRYVLEGSVQKADGRIRITAQLIDAATGNHLWAESYDRELRNVFAIQDEITLKVVTELEVKLTTGGRARIHAQTTKNFEALDYLLQAEKLFVLFRKEANLQARNLLTKAIELDPKFAHAMARLGYTYLMEIWFRWTDDPAQSLAQAEELASRARAVDETAYLSHIVLSRVHALKGQLDPAIAANRRAIEAAPNNAIGYTMLSHLLVWAGKPREGVALINKALRLEPYRGSALLYHAGDAYYFTGRFDEAISWYAKCLQRRQRGGLARRCRQMLIASYMEAERDKEARAAARKLLEFKPDFTIETAAKTLKANPFKDYSFLDRHLDLLRKAGVPE